MMNNDPDPAAPPAAAGPPARPHVAVLLNTTALLAAMTPKLPPYVGD
jgi:hypothetical protein